jgi:hypothetical protein
VGCSLLYNTAPGTLCEGLVIRGHSGYLHR